MYYVTGGMTESALMWTEAKDVSAMQEVLFGIIEAYERDFAKPPNISELPKISMIWKFIPSQLARENKKFLYRTVKEWTRGQEYESALQWLTDAGVVYKIYRSTAPGLPAVAYDDLTAFRSIWRMWDCYAAWRVWRLRPSARAIVCSSSSKAR